MKTNRVHRPARQIYPPSKADAFELVPPPALGDAPPGGIPLQSLLPVVGAMSSITMMTVMRGNSIMMLVGAVILVVALTGGVGTALSSRGRQIRQRRRSRGQYLDYLDDVRAEVGALRGNIFEGSLRANPHPNSLLWLVRDHSRLWERRRTHEDFMHARIGTIHLPWFGMKIPKNPNPLAPYDPMMIRAVEDVCRAYDAIQDMPLNIDLSGGMCITIVGDASERRALARSLLAQLVTFHSPSDLELALIADHDSIGHWDALNLSPHIAMRDEWDGPLPRRRVAATKSELLVEMSSGYRKRQKTAEELLKGRRGSQPQLVVLHDGGSEEVEPWDGPTGERTLESLGIVYIVLVDQIALEPGDTDIRLTVDASSGKPVVKVTDYRDEYSSTTEGTADLLNCGLFETLLSVLAPLELVETEGISDGSTAVNALELLGTADIEEFSSAQWVKRDPQDFLRVPIGTDDMGALSYLDIKESAQGGMGPHGICIGATGSGKSEFLRTLVLGMATRHSPDDLSMVLVDYKGGAAFNPLATLPHVAGLIDNLEGESGLIERAKSSISGEVLRRQKLLKSAGSYASITEYRSARQENPLLPRLPHLFIIIDEFGELLTAEPDFVDLLLSIGRIGRSIGVHMLLSSQRIEAGKLRGLDSYLSYRIGLRTFSESESHMVLNTSDAFFLPSEPGWGYLKVDTSVYSKFRSGFVSGPIPGPQVAGIDPASVVLALPPYNTISGLITQRSSGHLDEPAGREEEREPVIDAVVRRLEDSSIRVPSVWLPPLPNRMVLLDVLERHDRATMRIPMGLIDDPQHQDQSVWAINIDDAGGHHVVIGAPQSGRTTFLRAFAAGIATTHTPTQVSVYGLDLSGAGLARLSGFPHVGGVASREQAEELTRVVEELSLMLRQREEIFRDSSIESMEQFRSLHAAGSIQGVVSADVVLLVDGFGFLRTDYERLADAVSELLTRGGSYGIHVVAAVTRWAEIPIRLQPLFGSRYELRLNDPTESTIARKLSDSIKTPGRVLTQGKLFAQLAIPRIDDDEGSDAGEGLEVLSSRIAADWNGPLAAPIRLLPASLDPGVLPDMFEEPDRIPLGLRQDSMLPEYFEFEDLDQHLLILGDPQSGKTTLLRQILFEAAKRLAPEDLVIALLESRKMLATEIDEEYFGGVAHNGKSGHELVSAVAVELTKRRDQGLAAEPKIWVVVDDLDIISAGVGSPLAPLQPFLPQARDLGLTVIVSRPVSGVSRALFESSMQMLKEVGATGVLLSGDRAEGQIWPGVYASNTPPGRAKIIRRATQPRLLQVANRQGK